MRKRRNPEKSGIAKLAQLPVDVATGTAEAISEIPWYAWLAAGVIAVAATPFKSRQPAQAAPPSPAAWNPTSAPYFYDLTQAQQQNLLYEWGDDLDTPQSFSQKVYNQWLANQRNQAQSQLNLAAAQANRQAALDNLNAAVAARRTVAQPRVAQAVAEQAQYPVAKPNAVPAGSGLQTGPAYWK